MGVNPPLPAIYTDISQTGMEASRPNFNGFGLCVGLGCLSLGVGLGGPGFIYRVSRTGLGVEAGLET